MLPNVINAVIAGIIVLLIFVSCKDDSERERLRAKELELKEKELNIQERQLEVTKEEKMKAEGKRTLSQLYEECEKSVFLIIALDDDDELESYGSGFILRSDGVGVTNYHVLEGVEAVRIFIDESRIYRIKNILSANDSMDYVVFTMECGEQEWFQQVALAEVLPKIGEVCFAIGNPQGYTKTLSQGIISGYRESWIQNTAQITQGSSGGALFNDRGKVIGITTKGIESADLNFAINIVDIDEFKKIQSAQSKYANIAHRTIGRMTYNNYEILAVILKYFKAIEVHDYYTMKEIFAERLTRFVSRSGIAKEEAIREHERYAKTYPHPKREIDENTIDIKHNSDGSISVAMEVEVTIKRDSWLNSKSYRFLEYFELNSSLRIIAVRSREI